MTTKYDKNHPGRVGRCFSFMRSIRAVTGGTGNHGGFFVRAATGGTGVNGLNYSIYIYASSGCVYLCIIGVHVYWFPSIKLFFFVIVLFRSP